MKLSKVAQYFNNTKFFDAYAGLELGVGQLDVFDDSRRDGITAQRRIFEVAPGVGMPPRLAIQLHGTNWLVGVKEFDAFQGAVIREKHVLHLAEGLANVTTLEQTLQGAEPLQAYAARVWVKATSEVNTSSVKFNQLQIFFSKAEPLKVNMLVELDGALHTVMEVYGSTAGHLAAVSEELEAGAIETGAVTTTGWNPVTEVETVVNTPVKLVKLRWQSDFAYYSQATDNFERGDMQAACLTQQPNGTVITLAEGTWTVVASQFRNNVYYLHLRRA